MKETIKKAFLWWLVFTWTSLVSFFVFAYTNLDHWTSWQTITADIWNQLIDKVNEVWNNQNFYWFSAYQSTAQALSANTPTKINFQTKDYDTSNWYNNTTWRFQPTRAWYYQIESSIAVASSNCQISLWLYKNWVAERTMADWSTLILQWIHWSAQVYLNWTTDYIEIYWRISTAQNISAGRANTYFQASYLWN